ncbi:ATP-binding protein [Mucilaginibacter sp. PAMB04274]|uniref:ATP-binding protein n=1 Tax=Mucilaginibacter sp. PAMB04274 TaxID=3138568 RepID=UPI0031F67483
MPILLPFNTSSLRQTEEQQLNQARIQILRALLVAYAGIFVLLTLFYLIFERNYLLVRSSFILVVLVINLIWLLRGGSWRRIAHAFIFCLTLIIWTNILFIRQGVNLVMVQYIVLIVTCGFYLLEEKWGLVYATINIIPLLAYIYMNEYAGLSIASPIQNLNNTAYHVVLACNFVILIYIHYYFFREYKSVNVQQAENRRELQKALLAANHTAQEKTNFLATMSHELRTPLNAVIGMTNLLLIEKHTEEQKANLEVLQFSSDNLMSIINDILDFNKLDAGKTELRPVDFRLDVLLDRLCGTFKERAAAKGIDFQCQSAPELSGKTLHGDQVHLTQILFNLIGNAIKFTAVGTVAVLANVKTQAAEVLEVAFEISDTGIGIPSENLAQIFEPYTQSRASTNRQYHGTGLGLTIAKKLVELLGGELLLESEEGTGTKFNFTLLFKIAGETVVTRATVSHDQKELASLRVLVAEDNPLNVLVIRKLLKVWSITPTVVENGRLAIDAVVSCDYDVVLMDINMPVMDGFEASRLIRELPDSRKANIPIIALTASVGAAIEHHQAYAYLTDCILKPFKPDDLRSKLETLL